MAWRPIPAIDALQRDLDEEFSQRITPDWIIGDADHSSRLSDHNPEDADPGEEGWEEVHAIDIRLGGDLEAKAVLEATIGDQRVWYVIHNGIIYSRTYGWEARRYTGSNPHRTHIHVSFRYGEEYERDTSEFFERETKKVRRTPLAIDLSLVQEEFRAAVEGREVTMRIHVKRVQRALNAGYEAGLTVDGYVGKDTLNAWGRHENATEGTHRPRVPDAKSLGALVRAQYRMVA